MPTFAADLAWFKYGLHVPMQMLALGTALAYVVRWRVPPWWAWTVTVASVLAFAIDVGLTYPPPAGDLYGRWQEGRAVLDGTSPYVLPGCLYTPSAFPIFALFALLSFEQLVAVWTVLNAVGFTLLVWVAHRALQTLPGAESWRLPAPALGVLSAVIVLSGACRLGLQVGQLGLAVALAILLGMWGQQRGRPMWAGVGLALATLKPATLLPFLLMFRQRRDRATLAWAVAGTLGLCLLATAPPDLFGRLGECLHNISEQSKPTGCNYYANYAHVEILGLDRGLHYLGVQNPTAVAVLKWSLLLLGAAWLAWRCLGPAPLSEAAGWSLLAFYAVLFLYHRLYDTPILVIPLLYVIGRARACAGGARWLYTGCALAVLGVLYFRWETVAALSYGPAPQGLGGRILLAVVVPYAIWLTILGMGLLAAAEHWSARRRAATPLPAPLPQAA